MALSDSRVVKKFEAKDVLEIERQEALLDEMGLDRTETAKLRKTMLSANEAVAAKKEELTNIKQHKGRKKDWEEFVDAKRRQGHILHHVDFFARLRKIVPGLILADGRMRDTVSAYIWRRNSYTDPETKKVRSGIVYLGWVSTLWIPEFEIDIVDEAGVAIRSKRGWRTFLMRLLTRREPTVCKCYSDGRNYPCICPLGAPEAIVTEDQVKSAFGDPVGPTAYVYLEQMYQFRNG